MPSSLPPSLVFIGHPGHELRILGWIAAARPVVSVLTDGSGSAGHGRLDVTKATIEAAGGHMQPPFGPLTDAAVYEALLTGGFDALTDVAVTLVSTIVERRIERVVVDAIEGYNPTHDVCQLLAQAAVHAACRQGQRATVFEFEVVEASQHPDERNDVLLLELDDAGLDQKLALATAYARQAGQVLEQEVIGMIARHGPESFRRERLMPASSASLASRFGREAPFYETHGERRVREGKYSRALRLHEHLVPFERRLRDWVMSTS